MKHGPKYLSAAQLRELWLPVTLLLAGQDSRSGFPPAFLVLT